MKTHALILALAITCPAVALGQSSEAKAGKDSRHIVTVPPPEPVPFFNPKTLPYTKNERRAVRVARLLNARTLGAYRGVDGSVSYVFGEATPVIVCAPLRICAVALEPGEKVKDVMIGDSARWTVAPAVSGTGDTMRTHAVIKTQDVGLATNLIITTDRRTYHLTLKSARKDHMPLISFTYPQNAQAAWDSLRERTAAAKATEQVIRKVEEKKVIPGIGMSVDDLNFAYVINGTASWKPQRVFDDGVRTYIELPPSVVAQEAPIILLPNQGRDEMVNYRLKDNRYVVDSLIHSLILVRGIGNAQERVRIESTTAARGQMNTAVSSNEVN